MGKFLSAFLIVALFSIGSGGAHASQSWEVTSPDQGQTFAFGSEQHREWFARGNHLAVALHFTNDPYVDKIEFRQYDDFNFNFPTLILGKDGRTFFYHPPGEPPVPVAVKDAGFLGLQLKLLPSSYLLVRKIHGLITVSLVVSNSPRPATGED